jgi:hypothetical protein
MLAQGRLVGLIDTRVGTIHAQYMVYCTEYSGAYVPFISTYGYVCSVYGCCIP